MHLTNSQLESLASHKYAAGEYSYLDKKLNPFWEFVAKLIPQVILFPYISVFRQILSPFAASYSFAQPILSFSAMTPLYKKIFQIGFSFTLDSLCLCGRL